MISSFFSRKCEKTKNDGFCFNQMKSNGNHDSRFERKKKIEQIENHLSAHIWKNGCIELRIYL